MRALVVVIHGILTRQTSASWPDRFDAWLSCHAPGLRVLKKEYRAGPFPRWNCLVQNPRLTRGLLAEINLFLAANPAPVWFVAHSNGAVIVLMAARRLIESGIPVGGLILTGAACEADVDRNGVAAWIAGGRLGQALAYCAPGDAVVGGDEHLARGWWARLRACCRSWLLWPYGHLGRTGWTRRGRALTDPTTATEIGWRSRIPTEIPGADVRWFSGGHSTYFTEELREETFFLMLGDILSAPGSRSETEVPDEKP